MFLLTIVLHTVSAVPSPALLSEVSEESCSLVREETEVSHSCILEPECGEECRPVKEVECETVKEEQCYNIEEMMCDMIEVDCNTSHSAPY